MCKKYSKIRNRNIVLAPPFSKLEKDRKGRKVILLYFFEK
jgi:hypothetical protein